VVSGLPQSVAAVKRALECWPWGLAVLALGSVAFPLVALPAAFLALLGALSLGRLAASRARRARWLLGLSALASGIGLARFVVVEAMPGIVRGGRVAVERRAVSRLRDVLALQDALRRSAWIDPDGDGIGSAALIGELCGETPLRGQAPRASALLACGALVDTPLGPAVPHGAFLMSICIPRSSGDWSARAQGGDVDEELAERRFVAYAWPAAGGRSDRAFYIDEHDNIGEAPWSETGDAGGAGRVAGEPFDCSSAVDPRTRAGWTAWMGKKPRENLPGDPELAP
jgi:hypothetical protein